MRRTWRAALITRSVTCRRFDECPRITRCWTSSPYGRQRGHRRFEIEGDDLFEDGWRAAVDRAISDDGDLGEPSGRQE